MHKLLAIVLLILFVAPIQAWAQDTTIKLSEDGTPTTVKGHVNPLSDKTYCLIVKANQRIAIHLTSTSRKKLVKFNLRRDIRRRRFAT